MKNNLIGISGKAGHGKDEVGKIIQYLESYKKMRYRHPITFEDYQSFLSNGHHYNSSYSIKKFADRLKDIVCLLLGCTREQLEDREFKEAELGKNWKCYRSYSFLLDNECLWVDYATALDWADGAAVDVSEVRHTPRSLMQVLGTEALKDLIHPDIWVNALFSDDKVSQREGSGETPPKDSYSSWIVADVRFQNEAKAIKDRGGILLRVKRASVRSNSQHISETDLDEYVGFDHVIENNGTIEELIDKIIELDIV